jgi:hypothetical protein
LVYAYRALFVMKLMDDFALPDPNQDRAKLKFGLGLISFTVNGVCSTDLKDQFCMIKIQQTPADWTCAGMGTFLKNVGCCAPSAFDLAQGLCNVDKAVKIAQGGTSGCQGQLDAVRMQIDSCPGLNLGLSCAKVKYLLVHSALVTGIAPAWFAVAANKVRLIIELKKVIAFAIGVDIALITDLKIAAATAGNGRRLLQTGGIQVTTTITPPSFGATKSANELIGELDPLGVNDAIQTTTPGGSLGQPTIVGQSTTNIAANSNDASAVSPVFALLAGVGIFLF